MLEEERSDGGRGEGEKKQERRKRTRKEWRRSRRKKIWGGRWRQVGDERGANKGGAGEMEERGRGKQRQEPRM